MDSHTGADNASVMAFVMVRRTISLKGTKIVGNYGAYVASALIVNCAAGVGSLSIPKAVDEAGIVFGSLFMLISGFFSWISIQFVIEGISLALALIRNGVSRYSITEKVGDNNDNKDENRDDTDELGNSNSLNMKKLNSISASSITPSSSSSSSSSTSRAQTINEKQKLMNMKEKRDKDGDKNKDKDFGNTELGDIFDISSDERIRKESIKQIDEQCVTDVEEGYHNDDPFAITVKLEMGKVSEILWGRKGLILCYITLLIYFLGDVAIYCSGFSTTLQGILPIIPEEKGGTMADNYRIYAAIFIVIDLPLALLNLENTRILQIVLISIRFFSFFLMIVLSFIFIGGNYVEKGDVNMMASKWEFSRMPNLFGTITYSFMVHHSTSNFIGPVKEKGRLKVASMISYICLFVLYFLLTWSTSISFENGTVETCTINVEKFPDEVCMLQDMVCDSFINLGWWGGFFAYFLSIYPAVMLLFNNMFIVNTARSAILQLVSFMPNRPKLRWFLVTMMIYLPGVIIGLVVLDIGILIDITGGILGLFIMFIFPTLFVYEGRKMLKKYTTLDYKANINKSYFSHPSWLIVMLIWIIFCSILDVTNIVFMFLPDGGSENVEE